MAGHVEKHHSFEKEAELRRELIRLIAHPGAAPLTSGDRLTRAAARILNVPVVGVTTVEAHSQVTISGFAVISPWDRNREIPLSHSYCKHVISSDGSLVIESSLRHPVYAHNLATTELGVRAYAGFPIRVQEVCIGAFMVIDVRPRAWTADDLSTLLDFSKVVSAELEARFAARAP